MSRIYDNWEKLVEAVLRREKDRQLALFESFSSSVFSSRPSFDSDFSADAAAPCIPSILDSHTIKDIQFEEIKLSTQNFQPDMLLGEGRFGPVFKGWIHEHFLTAVKPGSGIAVAIRKLKRGAVFSLNEVFSLNRPHHPNLVKLMGYSFDEGSRVLVYEFMPNGSLDNHLFTRGHQPLSWETRVKVAIGAASGLSFFHNSAILVTHEGVNSSSILLDDEFNANWSDFGLIPIPTHMSTQVKNDYAAPECTATGGMTIKSDVYSFGIILLELLSGLRVCDENRVLEEQNLVVWAKPYLSNKRKLLKIVDSRLEGQYPHDEAYKIGKLAFKCLSLDPKSRPTMNEVEDTLQQFGSHYYQNPTELPTGIDRQKDPAWLSNWSVHGPVSRSLAQKVDPADLSSQNIFFFRNVMAIEYQEIKKATKNFHPDLCLGEGGFGGVYKGWLHEHYLTAVEHGPGIAVAVKKLNLEGFQGHKEWVDEINYLSQLRHPNLVKLIGYSFDTDDNRIVVYEFMPKGSLSNHLFTRGHQWIPWTTRVKVAIGAARALAFLHGLEISVIHRNIKSSNILLDGDFEAKLSGFSLARDGPAGDRTRVSTLVMGTYGYAAPEYLATGHLTTKCDVYGFGVVLLELISGLRVIDRNRPEGKKNLIDLAKPYLKEKRRLSRIMEKRLDGQYPLKEAYKFGKLALKCVSDDPRLRPRMSEVVAALEIL